MFSLTVNVDIISIGNFYETGLNSNYKFHILKPFYKLLLFEILNFELKKCELSLFVSFKTVTSKYRFYRNYT